MTTQTKKELPQLVKSVLKLLDKHIDTTGAILDDYVAGEAGMLIELAEADNNLKEAIEDLDTEGDFETALAMLEANKDDIDTEQVLELLDEDEVVEWTTRLGTCVVINVEGLEDKAKLEDFVRKNIYPYCLNPEQELVF